MNPWIEHVKAYAEKHNIPYDKAIALARPSYTPMHGVSLAKKKKKTLRVGKHCDDTRENIKKAIECLQATLN